MIAFINITSLLVFGFCAYKIQKVFFTPYNLVLTSLYIFHSGQLWVSLFKPDLNRFLLSEEYVISEGNAVYIYKLVTILLLIFWIVGFIFLKPSVKIKSQISIQRNLLTRRIVDIFYLISLYTEYQRISSVSVLGYGAGYHYTSDFALILSSFVNMMLFAMLYIYGNERQLFWKYFFMLMFRAILVMVLVGNRGSSVINILTALFVLSRFSYLKNKIWLTRRIITTFLIAFLFLLPFISLTRLGTNSYNNAFNEIGPIEYFFMEFGDTANNMFMTKSYLDVYPPFAGLQLLFTSLTIFPFSTYAFGDLITQFGYVGEILNEFTGMPGLGGSMLAQLYMNFGNSFYLYLCTGFISFVLVWMSNSLMTKDMSIYVSIIFIGLFAGLMTNVRGEIYDTMSYLKVSIYLSIILYVYNFYQNRKKYIQ